MVGADKKIYLIDFGLARRFRNPTTHLHIPLTRGHNLVGTIRYASINSQLGHELSRRDDLESLAYTLVYLVCGILPWQGIPLSRNTNRRTAVLRRKQELCEQSCDVVPPALATFLHYTRSLAFTEKPDYDHLHALLQKLPT